MSDQRFFETSDGTRLAVDIAGEGPPVVFQHGLCGDAGQTREAFPGDQNLRRITIEARGHGGSQPGPLERLSIATFAEDVAAFIENDLQQPVVVGGISMGAAIALRLAVRRPDLVRGLILARPAWVTDAAPANMAPNALVGRLLETLPPEEAKAAFLASPIGQMLAQEAPDNLASLMGFFQRQPIAVTAALLTAISRDGPGASEAEIRAVNVPALVIGHERDFIHPLSHAKILADMLPFARFVQITPKVENRQGYLSDFHQTITTFMKALKT